MKKITFLVFLSILTYPLFSFVVPSNDLTAKYGISYEEKQESNYIVKNGYSFQYLGNGTWDVKQLSQTSNSSTSYNSGNSSGFIFILIIIGVIIVIGVCVSNITTTVVKNSGMDDESANKVGKSAGVLAGIAAAIGAAILLGKAGGVKPKRK
jgi:hypothetical protein